MHPAFPQRAVLRSVVEVFADEVPTEWPQEQYGFQPGQVRFTAGVGASQTPNCPRLHSRLYLRRFLHFKAHWTAPSEIDQVHAESWLKMK